MTENLAKMVEDYKADKTTSKVTTTEEEIKEETKRSESSDTPGIIPLIPFNEWVKKYKDTLPDTSGIKLLTFKSDDIDGEDNILFKAPSNKTPGKKEPFAIKGATKIKVPDLKPSFIGFYNNDTFQMRFDVGDLIIRKEGDPEPRVIMKSYIAGKNIVNVFSIEIEKVADVVEGEETPAPKAILVPYLIENLKKVDSLTIKSPDIQKVFDGIGSPLDSEGLQLMYKPFIKEKDNITTTYNAVEWLFDKQVESIDPGHQIKIDNAIISIIKLA